MLHVVDVKQGAKHGCEYSCFICLQFHVQKSLCSAFVCRGCTHYLSFHLTSADESEYWGEQMRSVAGVRSRRAAC
jgi:hypothetical protein